VNDAPWEAGTDARTSDVDGASVEQSEPGRRSDAGKVVVERERPAWPFVREPDGEPRLTSQHPQEKSNGAGEDDVDELLSLFDEEYSADDEHDRTTALLSDTRNDGIAALTADGRTAGVDPPEWDDAVDPEDRVAGIALNEPTAVIALDEPTAVIAVDDRTRAFVPVPTATPSPATRFVTPVRSAEAARQPGRAGWRTRVGWLAAASVVLLITVIAVVVAAVSLAPAPEVTSNQAAPTADVTELEAAEADATQSYSSMQTAIAQHKDAALGAKASAASAAPAFAAVAGMTDEATLTAANAALAAVTAQLTGAALAAPPDPYARGDVDLTSVDDIAAAAKTAGNRAAEFVTATEEAQAARTALIEKVAALDAARLALGSSLPKAAETIVAQNGRPAQTFKDAVIAASVAVSAAQGAGTWGDAELLAYAAAVTALRQEQVRAPAPQPTPVAPAPPAQDDTGPGPDVSVPSVPEPDELPEPDEVPELDDPDFQMPDFEVPGLELPTFPED